MQDDHAVMTTPTTLTIERMVPGPVERVWSYLVDPDLRQRWFAAGPMDPRVGGRVRFEFDHSGISAAPTPEKYADEAVSAMAGEVTRWAPPTLLAFTWTENGDEASEVTITLTPEGDRVRLRLVHERLVGHETQIGVCAGWHAHLDLLTDLLEGRPARDFWVHHMPLEDAYRERLPG